MILLSKPREIDFSSLKLTFSDINNAPVTSPNSVSDWNTLFNLPTKGIEFDSVKISGNIVRLYGGGDMTLEPVFGFNTYLLKYEDYSGVTINMEGYCFGYAFNVKTIYAPNVVSAGDYCFAQANSLTSIYLPLLVTAGNYCFNSQYYNTNLQLPSLTGCTFGCFAVDSNLSNLYIPLCTNLGGTTGDNAVFDGITGNTINLTIPSSLMTNNGGSPDGDIQNLQANNVVTIITV